MEELGYPAIDKQLHGRYGGRSVPLEGLVEGLRHLLIWGLLFFWAGLWGSSSFYLCTALPFKYQAEAAPGLPFIPKKTPAVDAAAFSRCWKCSQKAA